MNQVLYALAGDGTVYEFDVNTLNPMNTGDQVPFRADVLNLVNIAAKRPQQPAPSPEKPPRFKFFLVFLGLAIVLLLVGLVVGQLDLGRTLTAVPEETDKTYKCFLLTSQKGGQSQVPDKKDDNTPNGASLTQVDLKPWKTLLLVWRLGERSRPIYSSLSTRHCCPALWMIQQVKMDWIWMD